MTPPPGPQGLDPAHDTDAMPRVGQRPSLWPVVAGLLGAGALGVIVFLQLDGNRRRIEEARLTDKAPSAAPLSIANVPPAPDVSRLAAPSPIVETPPAPLLPPPPPPVDLAPASAAPAGPSPTDMEHYRAPALIIDLGQYAAPEKVAQQAAPGQPLDPKAIAGALGGAAQPGGAIGPDGKVNSDEAFAQRFGVGSGKPATAKPLGDVSKTVLEGTLIPAVLETALNSDLPGYARAVVSRDVRGFDGKEVLIPRGTRLIGQYKNGVAQGQSRAFVIWTRLIRPDGAQVELASPATDALGRGGLAGEVDTHFLQRFGGALLLSLVDIGVASATSGATNTAIIVAGARTGDTATASIARDQTIAPTVKVPQGAPVRVFVGQDLDFSEVGAVKPAH